MAPSPRFRLPFYVCLLLCAGCSPKSAPPPQTTHGQFLHIILQISPPHPRQMDPTTFTVHVTNSMGKAVMGEAVTVDLGMPAMDMGRNEVTLKPAGPGVYKGTGRFTMAGRWQATVSAGQSRNHAQRVFPVEVQ